MQFDDSYFLPESIIARLQHALQSRAKLDHREWLISYFKIDNTPVRGIPTLEIRAELHRWYRTWQAEAQLIPPETERLVALQLLQQPHLEDKLAGILFLNEVLLQQQKLLPSHLPLFEPIFAAGCIDNRKVGDEFAKKVLVRLLVDAPSQVSAVLCERWMVSTQLWQARAALVALTELARDGVYQEALVGGCELLIRREETEAKSVVGSALRAVAKWHPQTVREFLNDDENLVLFDAGALNKATYNLGESEARRFKSRRKALQTNRGIGSRGGRVSGAGQGEVMTGGEEGGDVVASASASVSVSAGAGATVGTGAFAGEGSSSSRQQDVTVSVGILPGVAAAQDLGGPRDPLGIGARIPERMEEGVGLSMYEEAMERPTGFGQGGEGMFEPVEYGHFEEVGTLAAVQKEGEKDGGGERKEGDEGGS